MYKVCLSYKPSFKKPTSEEIGEISRSILGNEFKFTDIRDFATKISVEGYSTLLTKLYGSTPKKDSFNYGQFFLMLDFDNNDSNNIYTIDDLLEDEWMLNNACFYYKTFSDKESKVDKFRVVFVLDKVMKTNDRVEKNYQYLFKKYPQSDTTVGQASRIFFGSNQGYEEINFDNRLDIEDLKYDVTEREIEEFKSNIVVDESLPNYILLKYKQYDILKEKYKLKYSIKVSDIVSACNYFREIDMVEFLELPTEQPFLDILHEETSPSASVLFIKKTNIYLYKCFSKSYPFQGDMLHLLTKYLDLPGSVHVAELLLDVTNGEVALTEELKKEQEYADMFRWDLMSGKMAINNPALYSYLGRYAPEINAILDSIYKHTYIDNKTGEVRYLQYFSLDTLTTHVSNITKQKLTREKMWNVMNVLVVMDIIQKLPLDQIPIDLYKKLISNKINNNHLRMNNVYESSNLSEEGRETINRLAVILKENSITIRSLSFETVYRLFGEDKARNNFPQAYSPLEDLGLISMSEDEPLPSKISTNERIAVKIIFEEIKENGYILEDVLLSKLAKKLRIKKDNARYLYNKMRADIMSKYNLNRRRMTKEIHKSLLVREKYTSRVIIFPD